MYCIYCGRQIAEHKFCPACGKMQITVNSPLPGADPGSHQDAAGNGMGQPVDVGRPMPAPYTVYDQNRPAPGGFWTFPTPAPMGIPWGYIPPANAEKPGKGKSSRGKWVAVAVCFAVLLSAVLAYCLVNREDPYESAISDKIDGERLYGENMALPYRYNNAVLDAIEFRVLESDDATKTAMVEFVYVDVLSLSDSYTGNIYDPNSFYTYCIERITAGSAPKITETLLVFFADADFDEAGKLVVVDTEDMADVLTGGVASAYLEQIGGN